MTQTDPQCRDYSSENAHVLLVDDNPNNLMVVEEVLRPLGLTLVRATSGAEALREVLRHNFALILLDVNMPVMDGYETASTIRQRNQSRFVPIIFITALHDDPAAIYRAYSSGAVDYLTKPFNPEILVAKVRVFIELYLKEEQLKIQETRLHRAEMLQQEQEAKALVQRIEAEHLAQMAASSERQRRFLYDVLSSVTEGRLRLCYGEADLPRMLEACSETVLLSPKQGLADLRQGIRDAAPECKFTADRTNDLISAASEAGMNAIVHGGGGTATICRDPSGKIQIWIRDAGQGITIESLPRATLERGYSTKDTLGHGFWLMLNTADRVYILTGASGTTIVLEQDAEAHKSPWE